MKIHNCISNFCIVVFVLCCVIFLTSCKDDVQGDSLAGPTSIGDSIYIVTVDASGNPINHASVYYTCWLPSTPGPPNTDCRATAFINSTGVKVDTSTYIYIAPSPVVFQTATYFENEQAGNVDFSLYNYEKKKRLYTMINGVLSLGMFEYPIDSLYDSVRLPYSYPQQASTNGVYWFKLKKDYDTTTYWKKLLVFDRLQPMYVTNARGYVPISYNSLPFGEQFSRIAENGAILGTFIPQGDYLYVKCTAAGYKPSYGMINAYEHKEHILKVVLEKE